MTTKTITPYICNPFEVINFLMKKKFLFRENCKLIMSYLKPEYDDGEELIHYLATQFGEEINNLWVDNDVDFKVNYAKMIRNDLCRRFVRHRVSWKFSVEVPSHIIQKIPELRNLYRDFNKKRDVYLFDKKHYKEYHNTNIQFRICMVNDFQHYTQDFIYKIRLNKDSIVNYNKYIKSFRIGGKPSKTLYKNFKDYEAKKISKSLIRLLWTVTQ
tara:strand:+ start:390 stop:1031 length:642 start_codon:yes stop_codon:yes gene_type:complete